MSFAQYSAYALSIQCDCDLDRFVDEKKNLYADTASINKDLLALIHSLQDELYFEASIDGLDIRDSIVIVQLHLGEKYENFQIEFSDEFGATKTFKSLNALSTLKKKLLEEQMNNGYPFAKLKFEKLRVEEKELKASLTIEKNERVRFDEIKILGKAKLSQNFLFNYLDIERGAFYDQSLIDDVSRKLKQLNYVQLTGEPKLRFDKEGVDVYVFLDKRKASRFDLLLGLLPLNDPLLEQNLIITTLGLIDLNNVFENGENIYAKFEQLKPLTQELDLKFSWPFLFNSSFGLKSSGSFYKQDTAFIDLEYEIGLRYFLKGNNYIEAYLNNSVTNVLEIQPAGIINSKSLPSILDRRNTGFGIALFFNELDYLYNPSSGYLIKTKIAFGQKKILMNNDILDLVDPTDPDFSFESLYDEVSTEQDQLEYELEASYFFKIGTSSTLKTAARLGGIFSNGELLSNEQFRLGGAKLLRGFNEQSFFVNEYYLASLEYRLLLSRNTFGFAFIDIAQLENDALGTSNSLRPMGFGAGFSFDTNTGIFNISIALGKDLLNPDDFFDLGRPKIHLGYVSLF